MSASIDPEYPIIFSLGREAVLTEEGGRFGRNIQQPICIKPTVSFQSNTSMSFACCQTELTSRFEYCNSTSTR